MKLIKKALYFSAKAHDGQYRKGGTVPYISHPVFVAFGVQKYTNDEEIVAAALLHDVLEDCVSVTQEILNEEFGANITRMVLEMSSDSNEAYTTWKEKKEAYIHLVKNASPDTLLIIAVDKMQNGQAYFEALRKGIDVNQFFRGSPDEYKWYFDSIFQILGSRLGNDNPVVKDFSEFMSSI